MRTITVGERLQAGELYLTRNPLVEHKDPEALEADLANAKRAAVLIPHLAKLPKHVALERVDLQVGQQSAGVVDEGG
jgi:hypothetical protein